MFYWCKYFESWWGSQTRSVYTDPVKICYDILTDRWEELSLWCCGLSRKG